MKRLSLLLAALALKPLPLHAHHTGGYTATVYAPEFHGGPNYCDGSTYHHWGVSAASSWIPCGTKVRVNHRGRVLTVRIKDRCASCDIDLSAGAAYRLGVPLDGIGSVSLSY